MFLLLSVPPGVYSPQSSSYSSRLDILGSPRSLQPLPPVAIRPSGPPAMEYNSDSAESLQEIPVSSTRSGSLYSSGRSPRNFHVPNGNLSGSTGGSAKGTGSSSGRSSKGKRHKRRPQNSDGDLNSSSRSASFRNGASMTGFNLQDMPSTEIPPPVRKPRRHQDVPPLDLSSFNEDSDENSSSVRKKKVKKKKQITKI